MKYFYIDITVPQLPPVQASEPVATSDSLSFSWNPIPCESQGAPGLRYEYSLRIGDDVIVGNVTDDTMMTFPGLKSSTEYTFEVRAVNDIGDGPLLVRTVSTLTVGGGKHLFACHDITVFDTKYIMYTIALHQNTMHLRCNVYRIGH